MTKDDDFTLNDIAMNDRKHVVDEFTFIQGDELQTTNMLRNQIWDMYLLRIPAREAMLAVGLKKSAYYEHLKICKQRMDEYVTKHNLDLHGDAHNRLEDTIVDIDVMIEDHKVIMEECKEDGDVSGYTKLSKIVADLIDKRAKYMGCEPPRQVDVSLTSAEETRKYMENLFPSGDGDDIYD